MINKALDTSFARNLHTHATVPTSGYILVTYQKIK